MPSHAHKPTISLTHTFSQQPHTFSHASTHTPKQTHQHERPPIPSHVHVCTHSCLRLERSSYVIRTEACEALRDLNRAEGININMYSPSNPPLSHSLPPPSPPQTLTLMNKWNKSWPKPLFTFSCCHRESNAPCKSKKHKQLQLFVLNPTRIVW